ncbi:MAG: glycosyltransferase family 52 [bacterium]
MKKPTRIFLLGNLYSLLLVLLRYDDWNNSIFIFTGSINKKIYNNIKKYCLSFYFKRTYFKNNILNLLNYYFQNIRFAFFRIKHSKLLKSVDTYIGSDHHFAIFKNFYKKINKITLIEEGISNYTSEENIKKYFVGNKINYLIKRFLLLQWKLRKYIPYGNNSIVDKILLTGLQEIPDHIKDKVEIINMEEMWLSKSESRKKRINSFFFFEKDLYNKDCTVLLTQPLSEDNLCSEKEKINIYKEIIDKYKHDNIVIKKHPREKTNYSKYMEGIKVDNNSYPFELLLLNNKTVKRVITLFSTAAYNFRSYAEIIIVGTEDCDFLREKVGVIKSVQI